MEIAVKLITFIYIAEHYIHWWKNLHLLLKYSKKMTELWPFFLHNKLWISEHGTAFDMNKTVQRAMSRCGDSLNISLHYWTKKVRERVTIITLNRSHEMMFFSPNLSLISPWSTFNFCSNIQVHAIIKSYDKKRYW